MPRLGRGLFSKNSKKNKLFVPRMSNSALSSQWGPQFFELHIYQDRDKLNIRSTKEYTPHITIGEEIFLSIAAIDCSPLEFNALIAIPHTSGLQAGQKSSSNEVLQIKKLLPREMSGVTFHFFLPILQLIFIFFKGSL